MGFTLISYKVKLNTMTSDKREAKPITSCDFSNNEL